MKRIGDCCACTFIKELEAIGIWDEIIEYLSYSIDLETTGWHGQTPSMDMESFSDLVNTLHNLPALLDEC